MKKYAESCSASAAPTQLAEKVDENTGKPRRTQEGPMEEWHLKSLDEVFGGFASSEEGLRSNEARERLARFGRNQLKERGPLKSE